MGKRLISAIVMVAFGAGGALAQSPPPPALTGPLAPSGPPPEIRPSPPTSGGNPLPSLGSLGFDGPIFAPSLPPTPTEAPRQPERAPTSAPGFASADPTNPEATDQFVWGISPLSSTGHAAPDRAWIWGSVEALLGNTSGVNVPPVVTTGPASAGALAGAVGAPGTVALFGGRRMLDNWRAGARTEVGAWFGQSHLWGASARVYSLFSTSDQFVGEGNGTNVVNLPQVVTIDGQVVQMPVFVGFPGVAVGTVATTAQTTFTGGDINLRRLLASNPGFRFELFAGYRQMHLGDELGAAFRASGGLGAVILLSGDDTIRTRNNFYAGQVGSLGSIAMGRFTLQGQSAFAVGVNASDLDFSRSRVTTIGTTQVPIVQTEDGGRLNFFSVAAEGGVRIGFRVSEHAKLTVGYTGIYWSKVRRAQEQFDLSDSPTGGITHFYTNMLSVGGEVRY
jgi:hypothetical protein